METIARGVDLWTPGGGITPHEAGKVVCDFLDVTTTSFGRATHYNTREEQMAAEQKAHGHLFELGRDLYTVMLMLPGSTDRARQLGIRALLATGRDGNGMIDAALEREVLVWLLSQLPAPRLFKLFDSFRGRGESEFGSGKANNARTRKLVLSTLLGARRLELWTVKYRARMTRVLAHVWGQRTSSIIGSIMRKARWSEKEKGIVRKNVWRYTGKNPHALVIECLGFLYGRRDGLTLPLLKAFVDARGDISAGSGLPTEVLEGIRGTYHPTVKPEELLKLKAKTGTFTTHEKRVVQKRAKKAGVEVAMDPTRYDPVELYISAFENGADESVLKALDEKAAQAASAIPVSYDRIGIIVDASESMRGSAQQPLRPLAVALATRDMLEYTADEKVVVYCGGQLGDNGRVVKPMGDTSLADGLLHVVGEKPDAVYVISDGYENTPAGRFADVLGAVRRLGIDTPVFHLNPVFAAESGSVRQLGVGVEGITTMPVRTPTAIGTTMVRGLIEADPVRGINTLARMALKAAPVEGLKLLGGER